MMSSDRDDEGGYYSPIEEGDTSQVSEFFKDRCVFITGVSGFVGKEKKKAGQISHTKLKTNKRASVPVKDKSFHVHRSCNPLR
ncbi:unnamed protein product [Larinioides sclopetarius]|uniref:Uncharacterized protein n=1 Tax=Larinioides sclopetarius TaxID=280406 RepID=A0AAV2BI36_9ARAC